MLALHLLYILLSLLVSHLELQPLALMHPLSTDKKLPQSLRETQRMSVVDDNRITVEDEAGAKSQNHIENEETKRK